MKGFSIGRFLMTAGVILVIIAVAARIPALRKLVFNTAV